MDSHIVKMSFSQFVKNSELSVLSMALIIAYYISHKDDTYHIYGFTLGIQGGWVISGHSPMNSYTWLHPLDTLIDYSQQSLPCRLLSFLLRSLGLFIQCV